jgi:hypothetical protein
MESLKVRMVICALDIKTSKQKTGMNYANSRTRELYLSIQKTALFYKYHIQCEGLPMLM